MKHHPSRASRYFPAVFARASQASVLALALALSACQADEKKTETQTAPLTPSASPSTTPATTPTAPSAATPTAAQPGALTTLTLDPASSRLQIVAAKITRSHDGSFKQFTGSASLAGEQVQSVQIGGASHRRRLQLPKRMMSGWTTPRAWAISSRAISAVVEMPWTLSLNSSTFEAQRSASSRLTKPCW